MRPIPHGAGNEDVLRPWANGLAVTRQPEDTWIIDFDKQSQAAAGFYESPFTHVEGHVKPTRIELRRDWPRTHWWCYGDPRPAMRRELSEVHRQIITPRVAKYRIFMWFSSVVLPESAVTDVTRADDTPVGIMHSRFHELWSLRLGTSLEDRPRYTVAPDQPHRDLRAVRCDKAAFA